jgi:hypothetical protein
MVDCDVVVRNGENMRYCRWTSWFCLNVVLYYKNELHSEDSSHNTFNIGCSIRTCGDGGLLSSSQLRKWSLFVNYNIYLSGVISINLLTFFFGGMIVS